MNLGVAIKGELSASEDLALDGGLEGRISLPDHTLTVGSNAHIEADIVAKAVVVMGAVVGKVTAGERVEIWAPGAMTGDIASPRLAIVDGGVLCGRVERPPPFSSSH